jgi:pimeloyl-ACP methyl ester carboxylesterase
MTMPSTATTRSLAVPGARLHYEIRTAVDFAARRGDPPLLVIGSPMASADFASLADALASDRSVVTYDPRGHANSTIDDPDEESTPEQRADDIVAILDDLGADSADVFGSSGGAVTGLALVARHPGRVRALVAHEPPLLELLPDAVQQRANTEDIVATFQAAGLQAAWYKFMVNAGFDMTMPAKMPAEQTEPTEQDVREATRFFEHELRPTTRYLPDIDALKNGPSRVVIGIGVDSGHLLTDQTSRALAALLGSTPAEFPGDHGGFLAAPEEFAEALRKVLT